MVVFAHMAPLPTSLTFLTPAQPASLLCAVRAPLVSVQLCGQLHCQPLSSAPPINQPTNPPTNHPLAPQEQSFWVPCLKSARVVDSCEAPLEGDESAAAAAAATSSSHGGGSASEGQLAHEPCTAAAAMRRSNCLLAQLPAQAGGMDAPPAELRHSQPVIVTDYLQFSVLEEVPEEGEDEPGPGSNLITAGMGQQQQQQHPHPLAVIITDPRNGAASSAISLPPLPQTPGAEARRIRSDSGRGLAHGYAPQQWQQPLQPGQEDTHQHDQEGHAAFPDGQPHSPFGPLSLQRSSGSIGSRGSSYAGSFSSSFNAGSFSSSASQSRRVRALVAHGGSFKHTGLSGLWEYVGGAQKLVGLSKHASMGQLQAQLAAQAAAAGSGGMLPGSQVGQAGCWESKDLPWLGSLGLFGQPVSGSAWYGDGRGQGDHVRLADANQRGAPPIHSSKPEGCATHSFIHPFVHPFLYASMHPCIHPCMHPSVRASVHPSFRPSLGSVA